MENWVFRLARVIIAFLTRPTLKIVDSITLESLPTRTNTHIGTRLTLFDGLITFSYGLHIDSQCQERFTSLPHKWHCAPLPNMNILSITSLDPVTRCLPPMYVCLPVINVNGLHIIVVHISYSPGIVKSRDVKYISFVWYRDVNKKNCPGSPQKSGERLLGHNRENTRAIRGGKIAIAVTSHASPGISVSNEIDRPRVKRDYRPVISVV